MLKRLLKWLRRERPLAVVVYGDSFAADSPRMRELRARRMVEKARSEPN